MTMMWRFMHRWVEKNDFRLVSEDRIRRWYDMDVREASLRASSARSDERFTELHAEIDGLNAHIAELELGMIPRLEAQLEAYKGLYQGCVREHVE